MTMFPNSSRALLGLSALSIGCCATASQNVAPVPVVVEVPETPPPTYDVHEWGLVRGTAADTTMLSGPHAEEIAMPLAKPVLYFHRVGEGPLEVDVGVHVEGGRIVEHWPEAESAGEPGSDIHWQVRLGDQTCAGLRYPSAYSESPCSRLLRVGDACEAAALREVETSDSTCLVWPIVTPDQPGQTWNHLFYRAELNRDPHLPLDMHVDPSGVLHVTPRGTEPLVGSIIRIVRGNSASGVSDGASVVAAPTHGETVDIPVASGPFQPAMEALDASLRAAGLTPDETAAFRRAWDATLFGNNVIAAGEARPTVVTATPVAGGLVMPQATHSILYILPEPTADSLATLRFTPAPRNLRRVIVAWVDEPRS